jgi:hypothetical protein
MGTISGQFMKYAAYKYAHFVNCAEKFGQFMKLVISQTGYYSRFRHKLNVP